MNIKKHDIHGLFTGVDSATLERYHQLAFKQVGGLRGTPTYEDILAFKILELRASDLAKHYERLGVQWKARELPPFFCG